MGDDVLVVGLLTSHQFISHGPSEVSIPLPGRVPLPTKE